MFVKVTNGQVTKFPYTIADLRQENPQTSFPKEIPFDTLAEYGIYLVQQSLLPNIDNKTHRHEQKIEYINNTWMQVWQIIELPVEQASINVRSHRDRLLAETDWLGMKAYENNQNISAEWATYRQALRDIPAQTGFPYSVEWPSKP